ncbi:MAG TPA: patatin-like phospholipase family protein [Burkholderiales bacterium]
MDPGTTTKQPAADAKPKQSALSRLCRGLHCRKQTDPPAGLEEVLEKEKKAILEVSGQSIEEGGFLGLALSGGGIRSATFNLGVLQALAQRKLLSRTDYLSTVSGGGYIGSWLSALIQRWGNVKDVERELDPRQQAERGGREPDALKFLRRFSNYLTPQTGLFSSDTLSGAATYVRNLLLMQSVIVGVFAAVLAVPRLFPWLAKCGLVQSPWLCIAALFVAAVFINLNLARPLIAGRVQPPFFARQGFILGLIVAPLMLAAWLVGVLLLKPDAGPDLVLLGYTVPEKWADFIEPMGVFGLVWLAAWGLVEFGIVRPRMGGTNGGYTRSPTILIWLGITLAFGVGLLCLIRDGLQAAGGAALIWHWTVWGVPVLLGVFGLASILLIGLVGRQFGEEEREWWSRLGAWIIAGAVGWFALSAASIYGPYLILRAWAYVEALGLAWVVSTVAGVLLGKSKATGGKDSGKLIKYATEAAPYVFVAGLLLALSFGVHVGLLAWFGLDSPRSATGYFASLTAMLDAPRPASMPVVLLVGFVALLAWRLDINLFSFHMFYRNRLVRAYLGASRPLRNPHPFTGFDPDDNVRLTELPARPFQIVNTAINLTKANNLAWQERKAASFVLTREYCGYDLPAAGPTEPGKAGHQPAADYLKSRQGYLTLGQALTISGAAVSPNQGYHSSKAVAFLLTVFNVRLGWWMQNPGKPGAWDTPGPRLGLKYLLSEVFGLSDENSEFVYLSDGGHFENLGIYELVRRKCRFIIAIDSGMDPKFGFEDLGNAVRKCQVDFGVRIDIDTRASVPMPGTGKSLYHCGVGRIYYEEADKNAISGYLLYIKPSLTGNEPVDILQYASVNPEFPHQTTTDQWFDESQFEAYRNLGHYIATTVIERQAVEGPDGPEGKPRRLLDMFVDLGRRWYRPSERVEKHFTKHAERLMQLQDTMREQKDKLSFLDGQLVPEWDYLMGVDKPMVENSLWLPKDPEQLRAGFYFCLNLLELMQDVYLDLNLDEEWQHPDNRGWMNLFKHFAWAGMLRSTYAVVRSNFGSRFQRFCDVRLGLTAGEITIATIPRPPVTGAGLKAWTETLVETGHANFYEASLIHSFENPDPENPVKVAAFDALHSIRLVVSDIRRGEDAPEPKKSESDLIFPVGVALTLNGKIVCFRIQDHLRNGGMGREAMEKLFETYKTLDIPPNSPDARRIEYLFYSIKGSRP